MQNKHTQIERILSRAFSLLYTLEGGQSAIKFRSKLETALRDSGALNTYGYLQALHDADTPDFKADVEAILSGKPYTPRCT